MSLFSSTPSVLCRIAAIAAILLSGVGKTVHQRQHCHGNCGDVACCTKVPSQGPTCPFGCDSCHLAASAADQDGQKGPAPTHNAAECSVCQVLAMAPAITAIVQSPDFNDSVRRQPGGLSGILDDGVLSRAAHSRNCLSCCLNSFIGIWRRVLIFKATLAITKIAAAGLHTRASSGVTH